MDYGNVASAVRAGVIGQSIILDGVEREIIGVLRPNGGDCRARLRFTFLWKICARTKTTWIVENIRILRTAGRLKPNVTLAQATADLNNIAAELERRIPIQCWTPRHWLILLDSAVKDYKRGVTLASGRGRLCASHRLRQCRELTAARALERERELAVRACCESRGQLARQVLVESAILAVVGAIADVLLALWGLDAIKAVSPLAPPASLL